MPKAFLLKYKKRCEYFGNKLESEDPFKESTEALYQKKDSNFYKKDIVNKGKNFNCYIYNLGNKMARKYVYF